MLVPFLVFRVFYWSACCPIAVQGSKLSTNGRARFEWIAGMHSSTRKEWGKITLGVLYKFMVLLMNQFLFDSFANKLAFCYLLMTSQSNRTFKKKWHDVMSIWKQKSFGEKRVRIFMLHISHQVLKNVRSLIYYLNFKSPVNQSFVRWWSHSTTSVRKHFYFVEVYFFCLTRSHTTAR